MKGFDLTTLRLFVAVCEAKSIKRVADREQVDASAITRRLAKLEDQLQMPLIKRVRRGVQATPDGAILCEQAKKLVRDAQKIAIHLTRSKSALTGTLTLAASSANGALSLSELVSQCHPHTMLASLCLRVLQTSALNAACQHRIYLPRAILVT